MASLEGGDLLCKNCEAGEEITKNICGILEIIVQVKGLERLNCGQRRRREGADYPSVVYIALLIGVDANSWDSEGRRIG